MSRANRRPGGRRAGKAGLLATVAIALLYAGVAYLHGEAVGPALLRGAGHAGSGSAFTADAPGSRDSSGSMGPERPGAQPQRADSQAAGAIERAAETKRSGFMTRAEGRVAKLLPDDHEGARHQRFVIELPSGHTLLVAHNIDLAERVPLSRGDAVEIYGQYEWNERGGVLHWTHRDPQGRHAEGWIRHEGTTYE